MLVVILDHIFTNLFTQIPLHICIYSLCPLLPLPLHLKQHTFIILQLCKLEVRHKSDWANIKMSARLCSFLEALRENLGWSFKALASL
jgi:hypothetical protein